MTNQILFDRLIYIDRLKRANVNEDEARAHADALHAALGESVATKHDIIERLNAATKHDIMRLEQKFETFEQKFETFEHKITLRIGAMAIALYLALIATLPMLKSLHLL